MRSIEGFRERCERALGRLLRESSRKYRAKIREALAYYGSVEDVPEYFWRRMADSVNTQAAAAFQRFLRATYDASIDDLQEQEEHGSGWLWGILAATALAAALILPRRRTLPRAEPSDADPSRRPAPEIDEDFEDILDEKIGERAADYGQRVGDDYANGAKKRLSERIDERRLILRDLDPDLAAEQIEIAIDESMDSSILDMIVITRTTEAASQTRRDAAADASNATGVPVAEYWLTEHDEFGRPDDRVCPICRPLDGEPASVWEGDFPLGPPGHVNCRCDLRPVWSEPVPAPSSMSTGDFQA